MTLTAEVIDAAKSPVGGWAKEQLALLGVGWPPPKGWKAKVAGSEHTPDTIARFVTWHAQPRSRELDMAQ